MVYDIVIIGAGPAGLFGTYYACLNGLKVLLIEIDDEIGGKPLKLFPDKPIYDFPTLINVDGKKFVEILKNQLFQIEKQKYDIKTKVDIVDITKNNDLFILRDTNDNVYQSKYIILSTGYTSFTNKSINQEKIKTKNNINFYVYDVTKYKDKNVTIFGAGDSAIDNANLLATITNKINVVHHNNNIKAHAREKNKMLNNSNINLFLNYDVDFIDDNYVHLMNNDSNDKIKIKYDELLVCYGVELLPSNLSKTKILNQMYKLEVDDNNESINFNNLYGVGNITNKKTKDLILFSISDIAKVILEIMKKENIEMKQNTSFFH